jgi:S-formylglutathione hydrolase FrmB
LTESDATPARPTRAGVASRAASILADHPVSLASTMAFSTVHFFSELLGKQVAMNVILPDRGRGPFPVYYLLHGLSDDYTIWHRRTRIEYYVRDLPLIVVMPDGYRGFYTDNEQGPAYAKFFTEELTAFVERVFPARRHRAGRFVGGLSMGGYGAMRLALGYPHLYKSANSHSGALLAGSDPRPQRHEQIEFRRIFGARPAGSDHDLLALARRAAKSKQMPRLRIDCGTDDFLIGHNRTFHGALQKLGIAHEYDEYPGAHDWDYWDRHVMRAVRFHMGKMAKEETGGGNDE